MKTFRKPLKVLLQEYCLEKSSHPTKMEDKISRLVIPDLFNPIIAKPDQIHPQFLMLKNSTIHEAARNLLNDIFSKLPNPDNHFAREFQSQGFNSRVFELGLFQLLAETGFKISQEFDAPDYMLTKGKLRIAVEAVASSPKIVGKNTLNDIKKLSAAAEKNRAMHDFPIRAGSSLFSKIKKRYWELEQFKNIPLVFAYQALHEGGSLFFKPEYLIEYLFGVRLNDRFVTGFAKKNDKGHRKGEKKIPSGFFNQPDVENLSAVLFTNGLTIPKFFRMADIGEKNSSVDWYRRGIAYLPHPRFIVGLKFQYNRKDKLAAKEDWSQSAMLIHNPNAIHPIQPFLFPQFSHAFLRDGLLSIEVPRFHPIMSQMLMFGGHKKKPKKTGTKKAKVKSRPNKPVGKKR